MSDANKRLFQAFRKSDVEAIASALEDGGDLIGQTFSSASVGPLQIHGIDLSNAEFEECLLSGLAMQEGDLSGVFAHGTTWMDCDFSGTSLEGASFEGCVFRQCRFDGSVLAEAEFSGVEFSDCELLNLSFEETSLENVTINGGTLRNVAGQGELSGVVIRDASVEDFDTSGFELTACMTNVQPTPAGFSPLTGRRTRL